MAAPRVLQIGMDPGVIDFSPWPGQDADGLRVRIDAAEATLRDAGFDVVVCLLPGDPDAAESVVRRLLDADAALGELEVRRAGLAEAFTALTREDHIEKEAA